MNEAQKQDLMFKLTKILILTLMYSVFIYYISVHRQTNSPEQPHSTDTTTFWALLKT